jgi:phage terminase large subunit-like protein
MQDFEQLKQAKEKCIADLLDALPLYRERLDSIDARLYFYIDDALSNHASHSNLFELLGIRKTLRLMDSYKLDPDRAHRKLKAIEGEWRNGRHVKGGLRFMTPRGQQHVRLMPFQVYAECTIHMFLTDVSMERPWHEGDALLPTEWVNPDDGMVWDTRRLIQEAHWFFTRKSGKTELGAAEDFTEVCFLGDVNGQALICTNSAEQSQIAYKAIREFAMQVDPTCTNRMGGKFFRMTRQGMNWQPGHRMKGEIKCLSAGKTSKDGLYASVVHADEHGQARYINGVSDMQSTVETAWGSTGPRREKLLLHTTTAGNVNNGPYKTKLEQVEASLLHELDYPLGEPHRTPDDNWTAMLLQLDKWEITDDLTKLDDPELFKKVNRSIGTTVQPTYYKERLHDAATGTVDTKQEVMTKDFNMWRGLTVVEWIKPEVIRGLQNNKTIDDYRREDGWVIFTGLDFSQGDDLHTAGYLAARKHHSGHGYELFADFDAWIKQDVLEKSSIRPLYEEWIQKGWLHVSPGAVFQPSLFVIRFDKLLQRGCQFQYFGYDPYQSKDPINTLKAYLQEKGVAQPDKYVLPVSQRNAWFNAPTDDLAKAIKSPIPYITFSANPMWPWLFGNCVLSIDGKAGAAVDMDLGNKKPVKRNPGSDSCKVDPIQCICVALGLMTEYEGKNH